MLMGFIRTAVLAGVINVILFCATHRVLPAQWVAPDWRSLFRLSGFTESKPSQDRMKSFACRGTGRKNLEKGCLEEDEEPMSLRPQLDPLDAPQKSQMRIKIDNHIDIALQSGRNRDSMSNADRTTVPISQLAALQRPLPALVREKRKSTMSEVTMVIGGERWEI